MKKNKILSDGVLAFILITAILLIDQFIKIEVKTHFSLGESIHITDWFYISFVENNGMGCLIENEKEQDSFSCPQIKITFFEKDGENSPLSGETAGFAVAFDKINNQIVIYESNLFGKAKESAARYDVEGVTEDFLSLRIVKLLKEIVLR